MCLVILESDRKMHTASHDITVFKVLMRNLMSPYQQFQYVPNTIYHSNDSFRTEKSYGFHSFVVEGFHAFVTPSSARKLMNTLNAFYDPDQDEPKRGMVIVKFIIPTDAHYYNGYDREIVSDTIRSGDMTPLAKAKQSVK